MGYVPENTARTVYSMHYNVLIIYNTDVKIKSVVKSESIGFKLVKISVFVFKYTSLM